MRPHEIEPGMIFEDNDAKASGRYRTVEVIEIIGDQALCKSSTHWKRTRISVRRFVSGARGYTLIGRR